MLTNSQKKKILVIYVSPQAFKIAISAAVFLYIVAWILILVSPLASHLASLGLQSLCPNLLL